MSQDKFPTIMLIMLCFECGTGGAEKRYTRMFERLISDYGPQHRLVISKNLLQSLRQAGILLAHDPYLIVLDPPFRDKPRSIFKLFATIWYVWQCWRVISRVKPDIVHPLITGMYLALPALYLKPGLPCIMSAYSPTFEPEKERGTLGVKLGAAIRQLIFRRANIIDVLSDSIYNKLILRNIDASKMEIAPCSFTDYKFCQPDLHKKRWVVFLARFAHMKNPLLFAQAIPKVLAQEPDVHFYFLGNGPLQPQIEATLQDNQITEHITIRYEPHPTRILNQSAIFISVQVDENYPSQSLLEAMACGNAIVATDVGDTWRLVDDTTGIRVPPTAKAVAEAIIKLLRDPNLTERQQASRQRALSEHTLDRFFGYITEAYRMAAQAVLK